MRSRKREATKATGEATSVPLSAKCCTARARAFAEPSLLGSGFLWAKFGHEPSSFEELADRKSVV